MLRELFVRCLSRHPSSVDDADADDDDVARGPSDADKRSTLTRTDSAKRTASTSSTPTTLTPSSSLGKRTRKTPSSLSRVGSAREGSGATKTVAWAKDVETTMVVVKREEEAFGGRRREWLSSTTTAGGRSSSNASSMILSKDIFFNDAFRESLERRSRRT